MERANAALADYLVRSGRPVHLVAHEIADAWCETPGVTVHSVPRTRGVLTYGEHRLDRAGQAVAERVSALDSRTRVVVNGTNCRWADVNWLHYVHHAVDGVARDAPTWFKLRSRTAQAWALHRERSIVRSARVVIVNSDLTRGHAIDLVGADPGRVVRVYLSCDSSFGPVPLAQRREARAWLRLPDERKVAVFIGALGHDGRKGFATLWEAWRQLCADPEWDVDLVVVGAGRQQAGWVRRTRQAALSNRVQFIGFTARVPEVLAAADVLVSPVRYESYGLNVHEALCRNVPAIVSRQAGVAERYPTDLSALLLDDPRDASQLVETLRRWRGDVEGWRARIDPLSVELRRHSWDDMAAEMVAVVDGVSEETRVRAAS
jgi:glycosyltransferase involved in cell wall biosynthesis